MNGGDVGMFFQKTNKIKKLEKKIEKLERKLEHIEKFGVNEEVMTMRYGKITLQKLVRILKL